MGTKHVEILMKAIKEYDGWEYNIKTRLPLKWPCCPVCGHDHKARDPDDNKVRAFAYYLSTIIEKEEH